VAQTGTKGPAPIFSPMPTPLPHAEKTSKKINKNDKNFRFQNPLTCMYLTQPIFIENLKILILIFFAKKGFSKLKRL
jgi:hypothetical protein